MGRTEWREMEKETREFKKQAVKRMQKANDIGRLAQELGVSSANVISMEGQPTGTAKPVREPEPREKKLEEEIHWLKNR